jgi:hypothetical protein
MFDACPRRRTKGVAPYSRAHDRNTTHPPPLSSIGAVLAGLLFIFIVTTIVDVVLHATGVFPPWGQPMSDALFGLATAYRIVISTSRRGWRRIVRWGMRWCWG